MNKVAYTKPALTPDQLLDFLKRQGLEVKDSAEALQHLRRIGFYRLKIYTRPLQDANGHFKNAVEFNDIISLYEFDRKLRLLCLDAIERIEIALRSAILEHMTAIGGPHYYYAEDNFADKSFVTKFRFHGERENKHIAIKHYKEKYDPPHLPPAWTLLEASTFTLASKHFSALKIADRKAVSKMIGVPEAVLVNWLHSLTDLRNHCAHHQRLWNKHLIVHAPKKMKRYSDELRNNQSFYSRAVVLCVTLLGIYPVDAKKWADHLRTLMSEASPDMHREMGFPDNWKDRELWSQLQQEQAPA